MSISFSTSFPVISYSRFKTIFDAGGTVSYANVDIGYVAHCDINSHNFTTFVRQPPDIIDFETFITPFATLANTSIDAESILITPTLTESVRPTTTNNTSVAASTSNVTLLSSNTNRMGATISNDSTQSLFLKLGSTASSSSYTVKVLAGGYYETPFGYTGRIDGIWNVALGNARITELV